MTPTPEAAFEAFVDAIKESAQFVHQHPFCADPADRSAGYSFLVSMIIARLEEDVIFGHPDYPFFRVLDTRIREGGDNPDQRYLISRLAGGQTYRIWGNLGAARRIDLQIYSGDPYVAGSGGRAASFLAFEEISFADDGSYEIVTSPERRAGNWLANPSDATRILARQIYSDWTTAHPGEMHIDRVGHEGSLKPPITTEAMASRLDEAAAQLKTHVRVWPEMVRNDYMTLPPNQLSVPFDPGSKGGVPGRWMVHGTFHLGAQDALIVKTWPAGGNYQGIQLADLWFSSLEYANRQTSLTADQAHQSNDGAYYFVIAAQDPAVRNWLDTTGRPRGVILLRFDGVSGQAFQPPTYPTAWKIAFSELDAHLPPGTPRLSPEDRRSDIAARRKHVQIRFGH